MNWHHNWNNLTEDVNDGVPAGQPPTSPGMGGAPGNPTGPTPPQGGPDPANGMGGGPKVRDVSNDPQVPDMPPEKDDMDYQQWWKEYNKQSIKGDANVLIDLLNKVRERDLDPHQRKFVEDNLQVQFLRQDANVSKASGEIRKAIRQDMDRNNPSVSLVNHISTVLEQMPELSQVFIRMAGTQGLKGELHRRYIAALLGGVQVGIGGNTEDVLYNEKDYTSKISTRFNATFGNVHVGSWALKASDPQEYLEPPELKRLESGSPQEKETLRLRIIAESIHEHFRQRAMIVNVCGPDGTVYTLGWDVGTSLMAAYRQGSLVIKTKQVEGHPAMLTPDGKIVPFMDVKIMYSKDTGDQDEDGKPAKEDQEFLTWRDGQLVLTATIETMRDAATTIGQGIVFKEVPYQGNPTDLKTISRCVPSTFEILMRRC